jgi:hypothetical protein
MNFPDAVPYKSELIGSTVAGTVADLQDALGRGEIVNVDISAVGIGVKV